SCELCGTPGHKSVECQAGNPFAQPIEQVDYAGNFQRPPQNNPYSNTYNPGWRNHPNFSWSNQQNPRPPPPGYNQTHPPQQQKPSLEDLMSKFISTSEARFQNQEASIKNLETQIGQLAKMMFERVQGTLPSNTEPNPRGQVNAIFLGSVGEHHSEPLEFETNKLEEHKIETLSEQKDEGALELGKQAETNEKPLEKEGEKKKSRLFADEPIKEYKPRILYPQVLTHDKVKAQYG